MTASGEHEEAREALNEALRDFMDTPLEETRHERLERALDILRATRETAQEDGNATLVRAVEHVQERIREELEERLEARKARDREDGREAEL